MADNAKDRILNNIKRAECEMRLEKLSQHEILGKISHYKALALKLCEQIQTISWKISQADFVYGCEDKKRSNYLRKIERSDVMTRKFEIPNRPESSRNERGELMKTLSERLEVLRRTNAEKKKSISRIEKEFVALKKRNDSIRQKLLNDIEEWENQEKQLEDKLEQIQCCHSGDNFDFY